MTLSEHACQVSKHGLGRVADLPRSGKEEPGPHPKPNDAWKEAYKQYSSGRDIVPSQPSVYRERKRGFPDMPRGTGGTSLQAAKV